MKETSLARNYSLDAARGILMMLGAFIHAANIYSVADGWLIHDGNGNQIFDVLVKCIHTFRMPTFFWISGFFCAMTFERNGSEGLIRKRLPRILVPLIVTWATLNTVQVAFLAGYRGQDVAGALQGGVPLYHLWFLVDLMVFIFFASMLLPLSTKMLTLRDRLESLPLAGVLAFLVLTSYLFSFAARSTGVAYDSILHLTTLFRLASYAPFFVIGVLMFGHEQLRQTFFRIPSIAMFFALPLSLFAQKFSHDGHAVVRECSHLVEILMAWICVAAVLRLFHDLVNKESALARFLSDSAYTVYLFHHIVVVVTGVLLLEYALDYWLKFVIVCILSIGSSMLIHVMLIRKSHVARFLFNGK